MKRDHPLVRYLGLISLFLGLLCFLGALVNILAPLVIVPSLIPLAIGVAGAIHKPRRAAVAGVVLSSLAFANCIYWLIVE